MTYSISLLIALLVENESYSVGVNGGSHEHTEGRRVAGYLPEGRE